MVNTKKSIVLACLVAVALLFAAAFGLTLKAQKVFAENGLEIVSVGGNPVKAEPEEGDFDLGSFPIGYVGKPYSAQLVAEGGSGSYTWSIPIGSLPEGLTLDPDTGLVSGTPTEPRPSGQITFRVGDKNNDELHDSAPLGLLIAEDSWAPKIETLSVPYAVMGEEYYTELSCAAFSTFDVDWSIISGSLPLGLQLGKSGRWDGSISGTPTKKGTFTFTLKAENLIGSDTHQYTIVVDETFFVTCPEGKYYYSDTVQLTASIGNKKVDWEVVNKTSRSTNISSSGLLTIGLGEGEGTSEGLYILATSKTNENLSAFVWVDYYRSLAYSVTVIGGTATDALGTVISKAGTNELVNISAPDLQGKVFREWTVEQGSLEISSAQISDNSFFMIGEDVTVKANYDTIINSVSAIFTSPVNGSHPDKTIDTGNATYTATLIEIYDYTNARSVDLDEGVFSTDVEYRFYIKFTPAFGYVFSNDLTATINGQDVTNSLYQGNFSINYVAESEFHRYNITVNNGYAMRDGDYPYIDKAEGGATIDLVADYPQEGYVFEKWISSNGVTFADAYDNTTTFVMPYNDVTISATYLPLYQVSFDSNGGQGYWYPDNVKQGYTYELPNCGFGSPNGKEFDYWSVNNAKKNPGDKITVTANVTVKAIWKFTIYTISYQLEDDCVLSAPNPTEYTMDTLSFTLNNPTRNGYTFLGWGGTDLYEATVTVTVEKGSIGERYYYAHWEMTLYTITYNLDGGYNENQEGYYTNETVTLSEPEKDGYAFVGWSGTGINGISKEVVIEEGSYGDREYTAHWELVTYTITYDLDGGSLATPNPETYTILTDTFTLINPTKVGYTFTGWGGIYANYYMEVTIEKGTTGDRSYQANWQKNSYTIKFNANGGSGYLDDWPMTYDNYNYLPYNGTIEKNGYDFMGWATESTGSVVYQDGEDVINLTAEPNGEVTLFAVWSPTVYQIYYYLANGSIETPNPETYTIETEDFTLNNPIRYGYDFLGWTGTGLDGYTLTVTVQKGSTEDREYIAHWQLATYTITYDLDGGTLERDNRTTYTMETESFTLNDPTLEGYTFIGWRGTDIDVLSTLVSVPYGSVGDRTYIAVYNKEYDLSFDVGEGTGEMASQVVIGGAWFELPSCTMGAPNGKEFKCWSVNGKEIEVGDYVFINGDVVVTAVWQESVKRSSGSNGGGMSAGAVVGIVLGSVVVLGAGGFAIFWFVVKKKSWSELVSAVKNLFKKIKNKFIKKK